VRPEEPAAPTVVPLVEWPPYPDHVIHPFFSRPRSMNLSVSCNDWM
jgi:hypothetical protein